MSDEIIKCCGNILEWTLKWVDEDGRWYEKTCAKCGCKHKLKCKLGKETLAVLEGK